MKPLYKVLIAIILLGIVAAFAVGYLTANKEHVDLNAEKADITLPASQLFDEYEADEAAADAKYLNNIIEVEGVVESVNPTDEGGATVMIKNESDMFGVSCAFLKNPEFIPGQNVTVRGNCTGFLMDVNLSRCVAVN
ncbi:OB-fold putative lipoprotein [bacterium]|nr:OB-fold putative lipoprotein [bacterium]